MKLESVFDAGFREFGQVLEGYDFTSLLEALREKIPMPDDGVVYGRLKRRWKRRALSASCNRDISETCRFSWDIATGTTRSSTGSSTTGTAR
jgi:hypothetical protein